MKILTHQIHQIPIAEIISEKIIIKTIDDGVDLLGTLYFEGFDRLILHVKNINVDFFDLKTGMAGEILQKFSTYRVRLAIVGDLSVYSSQSMQAFIMESNRWGHINFAPTLTDALEILATG